MNQKFSEHSVPLVLTKAFQDGSIVIASRKSLREEDRALSPRSNCPGDLRHVTLKLWSPEAKGRLLNSLTQLT